MPCLLHEEEARADGAAGEHNWLEMPHVWLVSEVPGLSAQSLPLLRRQWPCACYPLWVQLIVPDWTLDPRPYAHCLAGDQSAFENLHCKR